MVGEVGSVIKRMREGYDRIESGQIFCCTKATYVQAEEKGPDHVVQMKLASMLNIPFHCQTAEKCSWCGGEFGLMVPNCMANLGQG